MTEREVLANAWGGLGKKVGDRVHVNPGRVEQAYDGVITGTGEAEWTHAKSKKKIKVPFIKVKKDDGGETVIHEGEGYVS